MRFRYSFQKIVDLKSNEKTQAEWYLSSAVGRLRDEEQSLDTLRSERQDVQETISKATADRITISEVMIYQQYLMHIDQRIVSKHEDLQMAERNVALQQENLTSKMMEEKKWFNARDKAKQLYTAAALKREQDELDEMALTRRKPS